MQQAGQPPGMPGMPGCPDAGCPAHRRRRIRTRRSSRRGSGSSRRSSARSASSSSTRRWDACPYCAQIAQQAAAAPAKLQTLKTQAFVIDAQRRPGQHAAARLDRAAAGRAARRAVHAVADDRRSAPIRSATIVLNDKFMSSQARRDQGRERRVDPARYRLDERHLRQQPSRRSSRAGRQRLHQVRQRDAEVQEPMSHDAIRASSAVAAVVGARRRCRVGDRARRGRRGVEVF